MKGDNVLPVTKFCSITLTFLLTAVIAPTLGPFNKA